MSHTIVSAIEPNDEGLHVWHVCNTHRRPTKSQLTWLKRRGTCCFGLCGFEFHTAD